MKSSFCQDLSFQRLSSSYSSGYSMAAAAAPTSIALRCGGGKAFLRSKDRMAVGDRAMEGGCCPPHLGRSCSPVAMKRWSARAALASPAQQAAGSVAVSTSACVDPFATRLLVGGDRATRVKHHEERDEARRGRDPVSPEKLDEWMRESVSEVCTVLGVSERHGSLNSPVPIPRSIGKITRSLN